MSECEEKAPSISVRLPGAVVATLERLAAEQGISRSDLLRNIIINFSESET